MVWNWGAPEKEKDKFKFSKLLWWLIYLEAKYRDWNISSNDKTQFLSQLRKDEVTWSIYKRMRNHANNLKSLKVKNNV